MNNKYDLSFLDNLNIPNNLNNKRKIKLHDYIVYRLQNPKLNERQIAANFNISIVTVTQLNKDLGFNMRGSTFHVKYMNTFYPNIKYCTLCNNYFNTDEHFIRTDGSCKLNKLRHDINRRNNYKRIQSVKQLEEVFIKSNYKCTKCQITNEDHLIDYGTNLHVDHIIPITKEGTNDLNNLQLLCRKCNVSKGNKII